MNSFNICSIKGHAIGAHPLSKGIAVALLAGLLRLVSSGWSTSDTRTRSPYYSNSPPPPPVQAQQGEYNDDGV